MLSFGAIASKVFGSSNERKLKKYGPVVAQINALEPEVAALSDEALRARTEEFRARVQAGTPLDDLIPEAFATVREAAKRTLGQRHFDVQLIGGMVLHEGRIAEMKTGEGKTLVATLPVYLNALAGNGVHVITVNDYLARRDAAWMGAIYKFLGLSVGCIVHDLSDPQRREQYACDVTYGTNNEFGFDYLRDNMKYAVSEMVQRGHVFAIVDEVDSILIDEARTPLIISGPLDDRSELYNTIDAFLPRLGEGDVELDEKTRVVTLTEAGNERVEQLLTEAGLLKGDSLYDIENVTVVHHVQQALRAHKLFQRDRDYIVKDDDVIIIDEFTGRMMQGRRYSEGLHQALEAKEHVSIQPENQTLATITFQNFFRLYEKLAGMTGTAATEADEFVDTYGLDVVEVPTNMDMIREDEDDEVYRTAQEKYRAIIALIKDAQKRGQPMLVGTVSIEKSEILAELLKKDKVPHQVLNARYHEQEAHIIAQAGVPGAITIATNMAGRGTDIQLGGNPDMLLEDWLAGQTEKGEEPTEQDDRQEAGGDRGRSRRQEAHGARRRRPLRGRHRAPREPPHRQPAARPLRPARRSRPLALLPVARRRFDAHLRVAAHGRHAGRARAQGGRGHRPSLDQQGAGEGASQGRGAQLRHPQEPAQIRQRDERSAQGDLRAAPRAVERCRSERDHRRHASPGHRRPGRQAHPGEVLRRAMGYRRLEGGDEDRVRPRPAAGRLGGGRGHRRCRAA